MYVYVKKDIGSNYVELTEELSSKLYNNIGFTYEDYLNYKWVRLTDEQVSFRQENPTATVEEVFNTQLKHSNNRTLEQAKKDILRMIDLYDQSTSVNSFIINDSIEAWFTVPERTNYKASIDAAKLLKIDLLTFYIDNVLLNITPEDAEKMLAQIQLYADQCYIVTQTHKLNISNLDNIEEVDNYNYMSGYPEKLKFNL